MKHPKLTVQKRDVLGKKVKKLRKSGLLPANIYGKDLQSIAVQVPTKEFQETFKEAGRTGLVDVELEGTIHPVLIHNVAMDFVAGQPLHADFFKVNLKEKMTAQVPVVTVGEAKAVTDKIGMIMTPLSQIEVEALPSDLPENIEVNVENLSELGQQITVGDLKAPSGVTILTDPTQVVASVAELVSEEAKEQAAEEAATAEEAKEGEEAASEANAEEVKEEAKEAKEEKAE